MCIEKTNWILDIQITAILIAGALQRENSAANIRHNYLRYTLPEEQ